MNGFEHVTLADLSKKDKDGFVRRWCELTMPPERHPAEARELIRDIHSTDRIEQLTGIPMLLTTMPLVKRKVGKLPSKRAELYNEAVRVLLRWRYEVGEPIDADEAEPQLYYIAFAMCDRGVQQLVKDEVIELLEQVRRDYPNNWYIKRHSPIDFLVLLERRTGLLVELAAAPFLKENSPEKNSPHDRLS